MSDFLEARHGPRWKWVLLLFGWIGFGVLYAAGLMMYRAIVFDEFVIGVPSARGGGSFDVHPGDTLGIVLFYVAFLLQVGIGGMFLWFTGRDLWRAHREQAKADPDPERA